MIALALAAAGAGVGVGVPMRIVSNNPCVDAILHALVPARRIAAISAWSQWPRSTSVPIGWAKARRAIGPTAEEAVSLRPDLFITGAPMPRATTDAIARLGVRTLSLPVPQSVDQSVGQVRAVARAVGTVAAGERLAMAIEDAARPARLPLIPALIRNQGGLVPGAGTLPDDLLRRAGFANVATARSWTPVPREYLALRPPRVLFNRDGTDVPVGTIAHPLPDRLLFCGGPTIIAAMATLRAARARVR